MLLVDNFCQVVITAPQHADEYLEILMAVKGSSKEKRLASQFIARFFKHFPTYADQAIEAQLDLCEDEDIAIRKQAIKDLPSLCKDSKDHTHKISDILAQLLQAEDSTELAAVHNSLMTLLKIDAKGTLSGLFSQIINGDDLIRERCIKFVTSKIKSLGHEVITKEVEDYLITECKKVLQDVNAEEFYQLLELLSWTRLGQTVAGQQELVDMIAEQADLNQDFEPQSPDNENVDRLLHCFKLALPYFSVSTILACFKLALPYFSVSTILACFKLALPYFSVSTILACFKLALPYFSVSTILACFKLALPYFSVSTILACFKLALPYFSVSTILACFKLALPYFSVSTILACFKLALPYFSVSTILACFKLALPYFSVSTILACFKLALPYFSVSTILACFKLALPYFSVSTILACFKLALPYFSVSTILACFKLALPYFSVSTILACFKLALPYFSVSTILACFKLALPYFSSQVNSTRFVSYVCEQVLPRLGEVKVQEEGSNPQLELLKLFAELCTHCGALDNADAKLDKIFNKLLDYMPLPPDTDPENPNQSEPRLEFSHVECLMYAYHRLGKQSPDTLTKDQDRLKDFKLRLQYFARGIQGYIKKLREALHGKTAEELKTEENKIKVIALKTTSNINTLIKDLFHSPPSFKSVISLSWKPTTGAAVGHAIHKDGGTTSTGQKRHTPITFSSDSPSSKHYKTEKSQREIYQPPSGKYSTKVSSYTPYQQQSRGGRARGRGGFRGTTRGFRGGRNWRRNY
ncbi:unnamed protein product [Timema podura]|uniref:Apoptosis inhibitor 5 n=2 Tax=Timema TaxID=61471 RepID=A0ABN7NTJ1_TIMPD|nr:unnamed protein product [Timema podura]